MGRQVRSPAPLRRVREVPAARAGTARCHLSVSGAPWGQRPARMELVSSSTSSDCWLYAINAIRYRRVRLSVLLPINTTEALRRLASRLTISSRVAGGSVASVRGTRDRTWPDPSRGIGLVSKSVASQFRLDLDTRSLVENR